jgi:hypothetical protein
MTTPFSRHSVRPASDRLPDAAHDCAHDPNKVRAMSRSPLRIRVPGRIAVSLRRLSIHRIRLLLTVSTIAVAAALIVSASGLAASIRGSTAKTARALAGSSDLEVAALSDGGFSADLADEVSAVEGVDVAAPILRSPVVINGVGALLVGVSPQALSLFPLNDATITDGGSGDLTAAEPLASGLGVAPGDAVVVAGADGARSSVVRSVISGGGIANAGAGAVAVSELRTAQVLAGRPGRVDSVMVRFADDANPAALRSRIAEVVGGRASVIDPGDSLRGAETALAGVNQALGAMAGLTLLVSAFVVFNMMSMSARTPPRAGPVASAGRQPQFGGCAVPDRGRDHWPSRCRPGQRAGAFWSSGNGRSPSSRRRISNEPDSAGGHCHRRGLTGPRDRHRNGGRRSSRRSSCRPVGLWSGGRAVRRTRRRHLPGHDGSPMVRSPRSARRGRPSTLPSSAVGHHDHSGARRRDDSRHRRGFGKSAVQHAGQPVGHFEFA